MGVTVEIKELKRLQEQLKKLEQTEADVFCRKAAQSLAARLLRKVYERTPTGDYSDTYEYSEEGGLVESGRQGGELKRAWLFDNASPSAEQQFAVTRKGSQYRIEIKNSKEYASYVEFGHRQQPGRFVPAIGKQLKEGWVEGVKMLTKSEEEIRNMAPRFLERELEIWLKEAMR